MLSKTRTSAIALVAALSVSGAAMTPAASAKQKLKNTGKESAWCLQLKSSYNRLKELVAEDWAAGDDEAVERDEEVMAHDLEAAKEAECKWSGTALVGPPPGTVQPGEFVGSQHAPEATSTPPRLTLPTASPPTAAH
jgi:hypothetical protein